jgi:hypothetical protein
MSYRNNTVYVGLVLSAHAISQRTLLNLPLPTNTAVVKHHKKWKKKQIQSGARNVEQKST